MDARRGGAARALSREVALPRQVCRSGASRRGRQERRRGRRILRLRQRVVVAQERESSVVEGTPSRRDRTALMAPCAPSAMECRRRWCAEQPPLRAGPACAGADGGLAVEVLTGSLRRVGPFPGARTKGPRRRSYASWTTSFGSRRIPDAASGSSRRDEEGWSTAATPALRAGQV